MNVTEAWNIMSDYISTLESLAETVDAYRDGDEVRDEEESQVNELDLRTEETGGTDKINEAFGLVYDILEPLMKKEKEEAK